MKFFKLILITFSNLIFAQNINNEYSKVEDGFNFIEFLFFKNSSEGSFVNYTHYGELQNEFKYTKQENKLVLNCKLNNNYYLVIDKDILIDNLNKEIYVDLKKYANNYTQYIFKNNKISSIDTKAFTNLNKNKKNKFIVGYEAYKKYGYNYVLGILEIR